jgi:hypothetical protein
LSSRAIKKSQTIKTMQNSTDKLPKRQAKALYQFRPVTGFLETTTTSSVDPTTTTSTIVTTTHIFGL